MAKSRKFTKEEKAHIALLFRQIESEKKYSHEKWKKYDKAKVPCGFVIFGCAMGLLKFYLVGSHELLKSVGEVGVGILHVAPIAPIVAIGILVFRSRELNKALW